MGLALQFNESGSVDPAPRAGGRRSTITEAALGDITAELKDPTAGEIAINRGRARGEQVHVSSIKRALHRHGYVVKKGAAGGFAAGRCGAGRVDARHPDVPGSSTPGSSGAGDSSAKSATSSAAPGPPPHQKPSPPGSSGSASTPDCECAPLERRRSRHGSVLAGPRRQLRRAPTFTRPTSRGSPPLAVEVRAPRGPSAGRRGTEKAQVGCPTRRLPAVRV